MRCSESSVHTSRVCERSAHQTGEQDRSRRLPHLSDDKVTSGTGTPVAGPVTISAQDRVGSRAQKAADKAATHHAARRHHLQRQRPNRLCPAAVGSFVSNPCPVQTGDIDMRTPWSKPYRSRVLSAQQSVQGLPETSTRAGYHNSNTAPTPAALSLTAGPSHQKAFVTTPCNSLRIARCHSKLHNYGCTEAGQPVAWLPESLSTHLQPLEGTWIINVPSSLQPRFAPHPWSL